MLRNSLVPEMIEMASYKLIGKILEVNGDCHAGHYVSEEFDLTLFSEVVTLQFGGNLPWEHDKNLFEAGCLDNYKQGCHADTKNRNITLKA
jgi:hypothetical protein